MDLLGMLKDQVSGTLVGQASKFLGESESSVGKALDGIFPSLLGSTIESAKDESGAGKLMDLLKGMDGDGMDDIAGIFSGGASGVSKLMNQGSGVMNLLMGNKSGGMIDSVAKFAGLRGSSASSLIKMAAPFLMRMIGKHVMKNGLNISGLMDFLGGQKSAVKSSMPGALASGLGLGFLGDAVNKVGDVASGAVGAAGDVAGSAVDTGKKVVSGAANLAGDAAGKVGNVASSAAGAVGDVGGAAVKTGGSLLKWLIPAFIALLALGFFGMKTGCGAVDDLASKTTEVTGNVVDGAKDMAGDAAGAVGNAAGAVGDAVGDAAGAVGDAVGGVFSNINEAAKAALDKVTFAAGSAGSQVMDYINGGFKGDGKFTFKNLTFATGSAKIDGATAVEIDNVASILKAYPDVKVHVSGYTDNTGDAAKNVTLSKNRADAVKTRLISKNGIAANRVTVDGKGSADPVGDNGTAEGRAANRRIEMTIIK